MGLGIRVHFGRDFVVGADTAFAGVNSASVGSACHVGGQGGEAGIFAGSIARFAGRNAGSNDAREDDGSEEAEGGVFVFHGFEFGYLRRDDGSSGQFQNHVRRIYLKA